MVHAFLFPLTSAFYRLDLFDDIILCRVANDCPLTTLTSSTFPAATDDCGLFDVMLSLPDRLRLLIAAGALSLFFFFICLSISIRLKGLVLCWTAFDFSEAVVSATNSSSNPKRSFDELRRACDDGRSLLASKNEKLLGPVAESGVWGTFAFKISPDVFLTHPFDRPLT